MRYLYHECSEWEALVGALECILAAIQLKGFAGVLINHHCTRDQDRVQCPAQQCFADSHKTKIFFCDTAWCFANMKPYKAENVFN